MRVYPNALLVCLTVLAACGGGDNTGPGPTAKQKLVIPEQLYQVDFNASTNDCNATNVEAFKGLVLPKSGGTTLLGLDTVPVPATVTDTDRVTFSDPIHLQGDTVVTFAGDWTFAEDRHTFTGNTTFAVSFGGPVVCTFTLATAGSHSPDLSAPPAAPNGEPSTDRITHPEKGPSFRIGPLALASLNSAGATWGVTADVVPYGGSCFIVTNGQTVEATLAPAEPFPDARNVRAGAEEDYVAFKWTVYGFSDEATAALSRLNNALGSFETVGKLYESNWYWRQVFDPKPYLAAPPDWIDFRQGKSTWSQSEDKFVNLSGPGFYYVVLDVYWYDREGIGYGWYRNPVGETCVVPTS